MSLLPDVERELMRVARLPEPAPASVAAGSGRSWMSPRFGGALPTVALALIVLGAVAVGGVFLAGLRSVHTRGDSGPALSGGTGGGFPGAPSTQRGNWRGGSACPLARANRYLPPRSGCVSVARADMYGDARPDLILVYARLSDRRIGKLYVPRYSILKIVRPGGATVQTRLQPSFSAPVILFAGHAGFDHVASVFIFNQQISSGASAVVYSVRQGRLVPAGATLGYGGDSAVQATFACLAASPPAVIQRTWLLERGGENGWWRRTVLTFVWRGARLVRIKRSSVLRHGAVVPVSPGQGCMNTSRHRVRASSGVVATLTERSGTCDAGHLSVSVDPNPIQVTQQQGDIFVIENRSGRACTLSGYPRIALITGERSLPFAYRHGGGPAVTTAPPRPLELRPGGRAYLEVAHNSCVGRTSERALKILITLPGGGGTIVAALVRTGAHEIDYCASRSDPGNLVKVSPVEPTFEALAFGSTS